MSNDLGTPFRRDEPLPTLAKLTELITRRLQSGEMVDATEFVKRYPARTRSLRVLLPTLFDLVELSRSVACKSSKFGHKQCLSNIIEDRINQ